MSAMAQVAPAAPDHPPDRRSGGRLDRDRLARPQRPRRRLRRDARPRQHASSARTATPPTAAPAASRPAAPGFVGVLVPLVYPAYFSGILAGAAEALFERDLQIVLSPTRQRARPRGLGARPSARPDRRRADHPARGVERGARAAPRQRLPVRRPRPADAARRADPVGLGRAYVGRRPGDAAPARPRAPAHRADRRARAAGSRPRIAAAGTAPRLRRPASSPIPRSRSSPMPEIDPGREAADTLLDLPDPPTAIFAFNDNIAIGADAGGASARPARPGGPVRSSASTTSSTRRS